MNKLRNYSFNELINSQKTIKDVTLYEVLDSFIEVGYSKSLINVDENIDENRVKLLHISDCIDIDNQKKIKSACHQVYEKSFLQSDNYEVIKGKCYREERFIDEYSRNEFHMLEVVVSCQKKDEKIHLSNFVGILKKLCSSLPVESKYKIEEATDNFINDDKMIAYQKIFKTKYELLVFSPKYRRYVSIGSINRHMNYFTNKFNLPVSRCSLCLGIGIERLEQVQNEYKI